MAIGDSSEEGDAIRALGHLFRLTEVFLWNDSGVGLSEASSSTRCDDLEEDSTNLTSLDVTCSSAFPKTNGISDHVNIEDVELAQEMDALGLPISFGTSKEKRCVVTGRQRKGANKKSLSSQNNPQNGHHSLRNLAHARSSQPSCDCLASFPSCIAEGNKSTKSNVDVEEEMAKTNNQCNGQFVGQAAAAVKGTFEKLTLDKENDLVLMNDIAKEKTEVNIYSKHNKVAVVPFDANYECFPEITPGDIEFESNVKEDGNLEPTSDLKFSTQDRNLEPTSDLKFPTEDRNLEPTSDLKFPTEDRNLEPTSDLKFPTNSNIEDTDVNAANSLKSSGDWRIVWDEFYMQYYFYNFTTQESTWYPPSGLEQLSYAETSEETIFDSVKDESCCGDTNDILQENESVSGNQNDKMLFHTIHELTSQSSQTVGNLTSDITLFSETERIDSDYLEEYMLGNGCPDTYLGEDITVSPFHSSAHGSDESLKYLQKESVLEKTWPSLSADFMNSDANKVDECFHGKVNNITFLNNCKESHGIPFSFDPVDCTAINGSDLKEDPGIHTLPSDVTSSDHGPDCYHDITTVKRKNKVRRIRSCQKKLDESSDAILPEEIQGFSSGIIKYWCQRYSLFSKFDYGVQMDEEGWFSVTPELIARHHASRCGNGTVIDCFTGVGGNAIQFAMKCNHVIAIDIDPLKIHYAHHNATVYGVGDHIDFIQGDFLYLPAKLKADVIFMSPPWGGPDYTKVQSYDIKTMLRPQNGNVLFDIARWIAPKVIMFLPRNVDINQLAELSLSAHPPWKLEVEKNFLNGKFKAITAYFSDNSK